VKPVQKNGGTGYAETDDGERVCYDCCAGRDRGFMAKEGRIILYLTERARDADSRKHYSVGNWPGTLRFQAVAHRGRHNIAGTRTDVWFTGPDGHIWHGVQFGNFSELCHCKRTKRVA